MAPDAFHAVLLLALVGSLTSIFLRASWHEEQHFAAAGVLQTKENAALHRKITHLKNAILRREDRKKAPDTSLQNERVKPVQQKELQDHELVQSTEKKAITELASEVAHLKAQASHNDAMNEHLLQDARLQILRERSVARWAEGRPAWCARLLESQRSPPNCVAPFTSMVNTFRIASIAQGRDSLLHQVGGTNTTTPNWMGANGQDWWVWYNHARFMSRPGTYVDLAANHPIWRSNTYFFDACLGWNGICIEASEQHHESIRHERSCSLVPACISDSPRLVRFNDRLGFTGGASKVLRDEVPMKDTSDFNADRSTRAPNQGRRMQGLVRTLKCRLLKEVLESSGLKHVDFLSLDIEGHEVPALASVNFSLVEIDIIIVENELVQDILERAGYRKQSVSKYFADFVFLRKGFTPLITERTGRLPEDWLHMRRCNAGECDPMSKSCWWPDAKPKVRVANPVPQEVRDANPVPKYTRPAFAAKAFRTNASSTNADFKKHLFAKRWNTTVSEIFA